MEEEEEVEQADGVREQTDRQADADDVEVEEEEEAEQADEVREWQTGRQTVRQAEI